jgi:hypothetical protein
LGTVPNLGDFDADDVDNDGDAGFGTSGLWALQSTLYLDTEPTRPKPCVAVVINIIRIKISKIWYCSQLFQVGNAYGEFRKLKFVNYLISTNY